MKFLKTRGGEDNTSSFFVFDKGLKMDGILTEVKKKIGIIEEVESFDIDIITDINAALATLTQIGIGPTDGFFIEDSSAVWTDFIADVTVLALVKNYVYMKVRMLFDASSMSSSVLESLKTQISEYEWRLSLYEGKERDY